MGIRSHNSNEAGSPLNALTAFLPGAAQGDTLVAIISTNDNANHNVLLVMDDSDNDWVQISGAKVQSGTDLGGFTDLDIWYVESAKNAGNVAITATIDGAAISAFGLAVYSLDLPGGLASLLAGTTETAILTNPFSGPALTGNNATWVAGFSSTAGGSSATVASPWTRDESIFNSGSISASVSGSGTETPVFTATQGFPAACSAVIFKSKGTTPAPSGPIFLGSVRVVAAPDGVSVPFVGTVKVIDAVPAGATNPYLGKIVIGTPGPHNTNPSLGEVVIVDADPDDAPDVFFGVVQES